METEDALKPQELEYIQLWLKAVEQLGPTDYIELSSMLGMGASLSSMQKDEILLESRKLRRNRLELRALLEEHAQLSQQAREIAQNEELEPVTRGVSATPEQRHHERVSDLVTALLTALNRDISKHPDLKRIMYDLNDRGAAKRRPNQ